VSACARAPESDRAPRGVRLVMGENFVVAVDAGTGAETGMPLYIGLGYLY